MEYTQEDWSVSDNGQNASDYHLLSVVTDTQQICRVAVRKNNAEAEANARLIAAAPALYEALKAALAYIKQEGQNTFSMPEAVGIIVQSEKALAKVEEVTK